VKTSTPTIVLTSIMLALQAGNCVVYFASGDWRRGLYWLGAVILTLGVSL